MPWWDKAWTDSAGNHNVQNRTRIRWSVCEKPRDKSRIHFWCTPLSLTGVSDSDSFLFPLQKVSFGDHLVRVVHLSWPDYFADNGHHLTKGRIMDDILASKEIIKDLISPMVIVCRWVLPIILSIWIRGRSRSRKNFDFGLNSRDGRSWIGLYIALSSAFDMLVSTRGVDIYGIVQKIKACRPDFFMHEVSVPTGNAGHFLWFL